MKFLLAMCLILAAAFAHSAEKPAATSKGDTLTGVVLESLDASSYTYLRLKTRDGEAWAAVPAVRVKTGAQVTVENGMTMQNFKSKSLDRTFPLIVLGDLAGAPRGAHAAAGDLPPGHAAAAKSPAAADVKVPKATGANARRVAEINAQSAELKDKPVVVRAMVVKFNGGIMGKNWLHLRDGSGSATDQTNDILVTTANEAKSGDVVTAAGVVRTGKNFGAGYAYKVMIEDATLKK